jgi:hypothetical protein
MGTYRHKLGRDWLDRDEYKFNHWMSSIRISIEHAFGYTGNLWSFIGYPKKQRKGAMPVGTYFTIAVLLSNIMVCLRGNISSKRYRCQPPSLEDYLQVAPSK